MKRRAFISLAGARTSHSLCPHCLSHSLFFTSANIGKILSVGSWTKGKRERKRRSLEITSFSKYSRTYFFSLCLGYNFISPYIYNFHQISAPRWKIRRKYNLSSELSINKRNNFYIACSRVGIRGKVIGKDWCICCSPGGLFESYILFSRLQTSRNFIKASFIKENYFLDFDEKSVFRKF